MFLTFNAETQRDLELSFQPPLESSESLGVTSNSLLPMPSSLGFIRVAMVMMDFVLPFLQDQENL